MFSFDADPNGMAGLAGINSEPTDGGVLPQVGANQPPMPAAPDAAALPTLVPEGYDSIVLPPEQSVDYGGAPAEIPLGAVLSADLLTGSGDASDRFATLNDALAQGYEQLKQFAGSPDLLTQMGVAFGNGFNAEVAGYLAGNWSNGIVNAPPIEVVSAAEIDGADAAFAGATKTIYISEELLARGSENTEVVANAWLEEYGHYVDSLVNVTDAPGDEGAIFAAVVRGEGLSQERLDALRVESDRAFVVIDGMEVEIEKAISSRLEDVWAAVLYYKDSPDEEWNRLTTTNELGETKTRVINFGSNTLDGNRIGFNDSWDERGNPSQAYNIGTELPNDYFAMKLYTITNFEAGQIYEFDVRADDGYAIGVHPLIEAEDGDGYEYLLDANNEKDWEVIARYAKDAYGDGVFGGQTHDFVPERSGAYLVQAIYVEETGDSYFDISWEGGSVGEQVGGGSYYPQLSSLSDDEWDRQTSDNTGFSDGWPDFFYDPNLASSEVEQIYADLNLDLFGNTTPYNMTAGYMDPGYFDDYKEWHAGIDIGAPTGTPVKAVASGTVQWISDDGFFVGISSLSGQNQWVYGHLNMNNLFEGQSINKGDTVGTVNSDNHLHFETRTPEGFGGTGGRSPDKNFIQRATMSPLQLYWMSRN